MLRVESIVLGVSDVRRAVEFWSAALDYVTHDPPEDDWAVLSPRTGPGVKLAIMVVSSAAEDHQRHHLDLYADDPPAEISRLEGLGATRVEWRYPSDADYTVLADPDGNRFCVVDALE